MVLVLITLTTISDAPAAQNENRYVHCNVFLQTACFGISQGDSLNMQIPFDFVLYQIEFGFGGKALIYSGYNPQEVGSDSVHLSSDCGRKSDSCNLYRVSPNQHRLLFEVDGDFLDISLSGVSNEDLDQLNSFLHNFRYCESPSSGVVCTDERIFENIKITSQTE